MNSSPPRPSFTLPQLNSSGQFPITPSPTPSPKEEKDESRLGLTPGKNGEERYEVAEDGGRVSMYVRLFEGEFLTLLEIVASGSLWPCVADEGQR